MSRRLQPSFRLTLSSVLVALVTLAVFAIGAVSLRLGSESATALSLQVLEQTLHRVDLRVRSFLRVAVRQSQLSERLLQSGQLPPTDFDALSRHLTQAMEVHRDLTNLGLGVEATGEFCMVSRKSDALSSVNYVREPDGTMRVDLYEPYVDGRRLVGHKPFDGYDPRRRPFYVGAVGAGEPAWTEAYLFFGAGGRGRVPGVTYGSPVRADDGSLVGVLHADFDLFALCRFLDGLRSEVPGFAFVVELRADGSRRAIAHPDPATLLTRTTGPDGKETHALARSAEEMGDPRVRAFLADMRAGRVSEASPAAEAGTLDVEVGGERHLGGYRLLQGADAPHWAICMMIPRARILEGVERNNRTTIWIGLGALAVAILLSILIATRIATPLSRIAAQSEQIGRFELDAPSLGRSPVAELDRLMVATDEMKASLKSFERYVPARLVREMFRAGVEAELGGESRTLTVYFSHVAEFESFRASVTAETLVARLGEYFAEITDEIESSQGTLDKYMGDAVMAFWGAPQSLEAHALHACRAALGGARRLAVLQRSWAAGGGKTFRASIGLNTGDLVVGNMGSPSRLNYTVLGDAVNLAARIEGLNRMYGTAILMGEGTYAAVADHVVARRVDRVAVKGKSRGIDVYELLAMQGEEAAADQASLVEAYASAFDAYLARRWAEAAAAFEAILAARPEDGPSQVLLARCRALAVEPPGDDWDGVHVMAHK